MRLFGYGLRRGVPMWTAALALVVAGASTTLSPSEAGRLLGLAGLTDPAGAHRAHLWSLLGLLGFILAVWRGAEFGGRLAGRDKGWIASRPANRGALAASALVGSAAAAWLFALALGLGVELRAGGGPGRQLHAAPKGPEVLRLAAGPEAARHATWQIAESGELLAAAQLELLVRPLAGEGRSATLTVASGKSATTWTIGAVRRIVAPLQADGTVHLTHGDTGPALAIFPREARITVPTLGRRLTSVSLGLRLSLLLSAAGALALGLGTRLGAGLATLLTFSIFAAVRTLGMADWFSALMITESGLVPRWPSPTSWLFCAAALGLAWALLTRALRTESRGGQA